MRAELACTRGQAHPVWCRQRGAAVAGLGVRGGITVAKLGRRAPPEAVDFWHIDSDRSSLDAARAQHTVYLTSAQAPAVRPSAHGGPLAGCGCLQHAADGCQAPGRGWAPPAAPEAKAGPPPAEAWLAG